MAQNRTLLFTGGFQTSFQGGTPKIIFLIPRNPLNNENIDKPEKVEKVVKFRFC